MGKIQLQLVHTHTHTQHRGFQHWATVFQLTAQLAVQTLRDSSGLLKVKSSALLPLKTAPLSPPAITLLLLLV